MISYAGKLVQAKKNEQLYTFDIHSLSEGFNATNDFIIHKQNGEIKYVINRICDHNGGKLIPRNNIAACPLHNWQLNLDTLEYTDSFIKKSKLDFTVSESTLNIKQPAYALKMQVEHKNDGTVTRERPDIEVVFLSHACIYIQAGDFSIITDPWLTGPAFMTGWWLNTPPKEAAVEYAKKAKLLYISHNHPDHLHPETLQHFFDKNIPIITAGFTSGSSEKMLRRSGFQNIHPLAFKDVYRWKNEDIYLSILKSGDFRDDSGIYLNIYGFEILMTVDSNFLNGFVLPEKLDLLLTSFASGASGYPVCFNTLDEAQKDGTLSRNRLAALIKIAEVIKLTNPCYYMPYAGYFNEKAERDNAIKQKNVKNTPDEVAQYIKKARPKTVVLNPQHFDKYIFSENNELKSEKINSPQLYNDGPDYTSAYITAYKNNYTPDDYMVINYFKGVGFSDALELFIVTTDDNFKPDGHGYFINFSQSNPLCIRMDIDALEEKYDSLSTNKKEFIYVRAEAFMCVIKNQLPWEDMSIGFQCRFKRSPDVYNAEFWHYFTNIYIGEEYFRYDSYCGGYCTKLNQSGVFF